jgi:hypothetical protein
MLSNLCKYPKYFHFKLNFLKREHSIGKDAGRPCFIMIGNNMTYEPSFEDSPLKK